MCFSYYAQKNELVCHDTLATLFLFLPIKVREGKPALSRPILAAVLLRVLRAHLFRPHQKHSQPPDVEMNEKTPALISATQNAKWLRSLPADQSRSRKGCQSLTSPSTSLPSFFIRTPRFFFCACTAGLLRGCRFDKRHFVLTSWISGACG